MVASYSSSLRWRLVFCLCRVEHDLYSKTSESGVDICEENLEKYRNASTVDYTTRMGKARRMDGR